MKNSAKNFDEIINFLAELYLEADENPNLHEVKEIEDISLPLAFAAKNGYATITEKGMRSIQETYDFMVSTAEQLQLDDLTDLLYVEEPIQPRKMIITIQTDGTIE